MELKPVELSDEQQGKIFVSEERLLDQDVDQWPSLGHYFIDRLTFHHPDVLIYLDHESGRQWTGSQVKSKILNVASALVDQYDFKAGTIICINYDNSDLSFILALAVVVAGGAVSCSYYEDPYRELLDLAQKVEPKFLFCYANKTHEGARLSEDLGYQIETIVMGYDSSESSNYEQFRYFKHLMDYDYTKSKCFGQLPMRSFDLRHQVAFITMSSGTTGLPKAVPLTQFNCISDLVNYRRSSGLKAIMACCASLDYVSGRIIALGAIQSGYTAIILNGFKPEIFLEAIERHRINVIYIGAASFYNLITYKTVDQYDLSSIRMVFPMGAKVTYLNELREFFRKHPNIVIVRQGYGSSETSGGAMNRFTPDEYLEDCDNCGKLLAGFKAKIVDIKTSKLLANNQLGILHLKGPTVFPGYYDMKLARAKEANRYSSSSGEKSPSDANDNYELANDSTLSPYYVDEQFFDQDGFYITGDLAYFNDRDELYIQGRQNELMCCRDAKKVLPQELEEVLKSHPAVYKSTVLGIQNQVDLIIHCPRAFVVPREVCFVEEDEIALSAIKTVRLMDCNQPQTSERLEFTGHNKLSKLTEHRRRSLAKDLMEYVNDRVAWAKQLTGGIVILDEIPTSRSTGKVDKNYLRSLNLNQVEIYGDRSHEAH